MSCINSVQACTHATTLPVSLKVLVFLLSPTGTGKVTLLRKLRQANVARDPRPCSQGPSSACSAYVYREELQERGVSIVKLPSAAADAEDPTDRLKELKREFKCVGLSSAICERAICDRVLQFASHYIESHASRTCTTPWEILPYDGIAWTSRKAFGSEAKLSDVWKEGAA